MVVDSIIAWPNGMPYTTQALDMPLTFRVADNSLWTRIEGQWARLDHLYDVVDAHGPGLMSSEDKRKLDTLFNYALPNASENELGGIKLGFYQESSETTDYYPVKTNYEGQAYIEVERGEALGNATHETSGLMSAEDKTKLDGLRNQWEVIDGNTYYSKQTAGTLDPNTFYFVQGSRRVDADTSL